MLWTRQQLTADHVAFLQDLPYVQFAYDAAFAHAAFDFPDNWEYVVEPKQARRCLKVTGARVHFLGHVHVPMLFVENPGGTVEQVTPEASRPCRLAADRRYLINVGSVGQPRDGNNAACFVLYDADAGEVSFQRVAYDYRKTARKIATTGLHAFYGERLAVGK